jgi:hypothetical protein
MGWVHCPHLSLERTFRSAPAGQQIYARGAAGLDAGEPFVAQLGEFDTTGAVHLLPPR